MKLTTLTFAVLASVTVLTGCQDETSVEWYMAHHDDMLAKYEECLNSNTWSADDCAHANTAYKRERDKPDVFAKHKEIIERYNSK